MGSAVASIRAKVDEAAVRRAAVARGSSTWCVPRSLRARCRRSMMASHSEMVRMASESDELSVLSRRRSSSAIPSARSRSCRRATASGWLKTSTGGVNGANGGGSRRTTGRDAGRCAVKIQISPFLFVSKILLGGLFFFSLYERAGRRLAGWLAGSARLIDIFLVYFNPAKTNSNFNFLFTSPRVHRHRRWRECRWSGSGAC
jgi:hypothetical protein